MATRRRRAKLQSGFSLGGESAEVDPLLEPAFFESSDYRVIQSRTDRRCFIIGRTGAGKSAALQHLEETEDDRVIRISPASLSMPYITDLQVFRYLDSLDVHLDLLWIATLETRAPGRDPPTQVQGGHAGGEAERDDGVA
jgi:hypothetical protein